MSNQDSGASSPESLAQWDHSLSLWRTSQGSLGLDSTASCLSLPTSGTMRNGTLYPRVAWEPHTHVPGCSLWVTPAARDHKDTPGMNRVRPDGRSRVDQLARQVYARDNLGAGDGTLNPAWVEWLMGFPDGWLDSVPSVTRSSRSARKSSGDGSSK